jgi:flagellar protein FliO/FliZ
MRLLLPLLPILLLGLSVQNSAAGIEPPSPFSSTLRLIWGLLIVLGILLIIYALAKKKLSFLQGGNGKGAITIVETRHLMPRKSLCLVNVRGREYLLGLSNEQINLIAALDHHASPPGSTNSPAYQDFAATLATAKSENRDTPT